MHSSPHFLQLMCTNNNILGLLESKKLNKTIWKWIIFWKDKYNNPKKYLIYHNKSLYSGSLICMDFKLYYIKYIHGFKWVLTIINYKKQKLWVLPGPDKILPIDKLHYFYLLWRGNILKY